MGLRKIILLEGEVYHIFNKSCYDIPLFKNKKEFSLFLETVRFYLQPQPPVKFSKYRKNRKRYPFDLSKRLVTVICFCLMPNHFHFLLKQEVKDGIKKFIQRVCNSYSHYFNSKYQTGGSLFKGNFKAVRVENDTQLLHLSRYIHLNPVTAYLVNHPEDYFFSSYLEYIGERKSDFLDPSLVLDQFSSTRDYKEFVLSRKDYQRELERIKHLLIE